MNTTEGLCVVCVGCLLFTCSEGDRVCTCAGLSVGMCLCGSACWTGQMVLLYSAEERETHSPGQMGRDSFASEVAE